MGKITTKEAPSAIGPYSQGIEANGFLFVSGQIPINPDTGELIREDIKASAEQAIKNFFAIVKAGGGKKVVKVTLYLTNPDHFALVNEVYAKYFKDDLPARTTVFVSALPKGAPVEIEGIATY